MALFAGDPDTVTGAFTAHVTHTQSQATQASWQTVRPFQTGRLESCRTRSEKIQVPGCSWL